MEDENMGILLIMLIIVGSLMIIFGINYYNLTRFKECYDNSFKLDYCEKYKNY